MRICIVSKLLIFFVFSFGCMTNKSKQQNAVNAKNSFKNDFLSRVKFDSSIYLIEKKAPNLTSSHDLFNVNEFEYLFSNDSLYIQDCLNFISNEKNTYSQKVISIFSMQNLKEEDYFYFFGECVKKYDSSIISEDLLQVIIYPHLDTKSFIVKSYANPTVKNLLLKIRETPRITNRLRGLLDLILSGELWHNIKNA